MVYIWHQICLNNGQVFSLFFLGKGLFYAFGIKFNNLIIVSNHNNLLPDVIRPPVYCEDKYIYRTKV